MMDRHRLYKSLGWSGVVVLALSAVGLLAFRHFSEKLCHGFWAPLEDWRADKFLSKPPPPASDKFEDWPRELNELEISFDRLEMPYFEAADVQLSLIRGVATVPEKNSFAKIVIKCRAGAVQGLLLSDVDITIEDAVLDMDRLFRDKELIFLSVRKISPTFSIPQEAVHRFLAGKWKILKDVSLVFDEHIELSGRFYGLLPVYARINARLEPAKEFLTIELTRVVVGGISLDGFLGKDCRIRTVLLRLPGNRPVEMAVGGLSFENGRMRVFGGIE